MRFLCLSFSLFLLQMLSCDIDPTGLPVKREDLYGKFFANYGAGLVEYIEFKADSTYSYYFKGADGREFTSHDRWMLLGGEERMDRAGVMLFNFSVPYRLEDGCYSPNADPAFAHPPPGAYSVAIYKVAGGDTYLRRCPNEIQYYVKLAQK
jgi:hypothetical protein